MPKRKRRRLPVTPPVRDIQDVKPPPWESGGPAKSPSARSRQARAIIGSEVERERERKAAEARKRRRRRARKLLARKHGRSVKVKRKGSK